MLKQLNSNIINLKKAISSLQETDLEIEASSNYYNYKTNKINYNKQLIEISLENLKSALWQLNVVYKLTEDTFSKLTFLLDELFSYLNEKDFDRMMEILTEFSDLIRNLGLKEDEKEISFKLPQRIPEEIKEDLLADLRELEKCFKSKCYRSSIILCGRILETALHRKYYELTGRDILEKSPGIGLGKMIAKLTEKNVKIDPGLTQQIHLINQVRIFSVHKKSNVFEPTMEQTYAIMLFTLDALKKIFA